MQQMSLVHPKSSLHAFHCSVRCMPCVADLSRAPVEQKKMTFSSLQTKKLHSAARRLRSSQRAARDSARTRLHLHSTRSTTHDLPEGCIWHLLTSDTFSHLVKSESFSIWYLLTSSYIWHLLTSDIFLTFDISSHFIFSPLPSSHIISYLASHIFSSLSLFLLKGGRPSRPPRKCEKISDVRRCQMWEDIWEDIRFEKMSDVRRCGKIIRY